MDLDAQCIPLAHILTYFSIREKPRFEVDNGLAPLDSERPSRERHIETLISITLGMDYQEIFQNLGVDLSDGVIADRYLSTRQVLTLVEQAIDRLNMPYLGLFIGNIMTVSHYGMAGLAVVTQPNLRECCLLLSRFCREYFPPLEISVHVDEDVSWIAIEENISLKPYQEFFIELNFVSFYNMVYDLVGHDSKMMPIRIELAYPEPAWGHIYRRYFNCPVVFNRPQNRMIRKTHGIDLDLPLANRLLAITAEKVFLQNIPTRAMKYLPLKLKHFLARSYGAYPTLEKSARELGVSSRTLRRKLAEEGTSYKQEVDKVKERFAREYFARGGRSVAELANLLGFSNTPAFTRAFKRWTSLTPSEFILKTTGINIELVD